MATKSSTDQSKKLKAGRLCVYSDLPIRGVAMAARTCPYFIAPIILFGFTVVAFILLKPQRRAIRNNLKVLNPDAGTFQLWREVFAVFHEFSRSISDAAYVRCGRDMLTWEIENPSAFDELTRKHEKGAILLTAHMGNYDLAGSLFSDKFPAPVHSVRAPERDPFAQEAKEKELSEKSRDGYVIHFNKGSESVLGLELAKALSKGEYVAIQGDRTVFDVATLDAEVPDQENTTMKIPAGPFVLAQISGAPIFPLFVKRTGHLKYCVVAHEPIYVANERSRRAELQYEGVQKWMATLLPTLRENRKQWLVFESAFFEGSGVGDEDASRNSDFSIEREPVRDPVIQPPGFWESHIGAAMAVLMIGGALLVSGIEWFGWKALWFLIPTLPVTVFLAFNFFGAITSLVTMIGWSKSKRPWIASTIFLGLVLSGLAVALCVTGGWFLKAVSLPWLIWILIVSLRSLRKA